MITFFIDLWHDLREKRLWPVAVGLLAAIVAVPVILFKPASEAAPPSTAAPKPGGAATLPVVAVDAGPTVGSRLEAFNEKNPFKPMKDLAKSSTADSGSTSGGGSSSGGSSSSGSAGGSLANPTSGGSSSGGSSPSGGSTPSGGTPSNPATVHWFHYVADFKFGEPGKPKKFKSQATLTLLPDEKTPSIVFMGVADDHKSAVFFISDPAFQAEGEGTCNAKGAECRFVTMTLGESGDEETFTAVDGSVSYDLKLLAIRREDIPSDKAGTPKGKAAPKSPKGLGATGAGVATATQATLSAVPSLISTGPGIALETK